MMRTPTPPPGRPRDPGRTHGTVPQLLQTLQVGFDFPVHFTRDVFAPSNTRLADAISRKEPSRRHRVLVVLDRGVAEAVGDLQPRMHRYFSEHRDRLLMLAAPMVMDGGETIKNDAGALQSLLRKLCELSMDRHSVVLVVGGGALLDTAGYAAAITHRGLRVVRVPTTVLSQSVSGVSIKNGINAFGRKDFHGVFWPPFAVLNDILLLETLPRRERLGGLAEAVKAALLKDGAFFGWIRERATALAQGDEQALSLLIQRTAQLHLHHVAIGNDAFEQYSAQPLALGQWAAHKLVSLSKGGLRHGEALAIGMALDTTYAQRVGLCEPDVTDAVLHTLSQLGFRLWDESLEVRRPDGKPRVLEGLGEFREETGGELTLTLLRRIGEGTCVHDVDEALMLDALQKLREREAGA
ncbi:MAG: 3-dehydroquinate synthase [Myxococcota bacterium]